MQEKLIEIETSNEKINSFASRMQLKTEREKEIKKQIEQLTADLALCVEDISKGMSRLETNKKQDAE